MRLINRSIKACRSGFSIILFLSLITTSYSQIRIYPMLGRAFTYTKMKEGNEHILPTYNRFQDFLGFSLEKNLNQYKSIAFSLERTDLGMGIQSSYKSKVQIIDHVKIYREIGNFGNYEGRVQTVLALKYYTTLYSLYYRNKNQNSKLQNYRSMELRPFVGLGLNIPDQRGWTETCDDTLGNTQVNPDSENPGITMSSGSSFFEYLNCGYGKKVLKHKLGTSIQVGFRLQFKKNDKERLAINVIYSQGLLTLLESPYKATYYNHSFEKVTGAGVFFNRGSFLGISASYPIIILNKKGERRSDRKLNYN